VATLAAGWHTVILPRTPWHTCNERQSLKEQNQGVAFIELPNKNQPMTLFGVPFNSGVPPVTGSSASSGSKEDALKHLM